MPIPRETLEELTQLRARNEELEAMIRDGRKAKDDAVTALRRNTGLTVGQARMLAALAQGGIMTREQLLDSQFGHCDTADAYEMDIRNVDSTIKRLRKALARVMPKVVITAHYGLGYELAGESLAAVRRMIKGRD